MIILALLFFIFAVICLGFFALIFGLFWLYTAKYNPDSLWKANHLASVGKDAILAIFGVFAFVIFFNILLIIAESISYMLK